MHSSTTTARGILRRLALGLVLAALAAAAAVPAAVARLDDGSGVRAGNAGASHLVVDALSRHFARQSSQGVPDVLDRNLANLQQGVPDVLDRYLANLQQGGEQDALDRFLRNDRAHSSPDALFRHSERQASRTGPNIVVDVLGRHFANQKSHPSSVVIAETASGTFPWREIAIGVASGIGVLLLFAGSTLAVRRSRRRIAGL